MWCPSIRGRTGTALQAGKGGGGGPWDKPAGPADGSKGARRRPPPPLAGPLPKSNSSRPDRAPPPLAGGSGSSKRSASQRYRRPSASGATGPRATQAPRAAPASYYLTPPIQVQHLETLTKTEGAETPRTGTFCNHLNGYWVGQSAAFTPWAGLTEPVWVDADGKYVDVVYSRTLEQMMANQAGQDCLVRKVARAGTLEELAAVRLPSEGLDGGPDEVDVEEVGLNSGGDVIFNGGHYSSGPSRIGVPRGVAETASVPSTSGSSSSSSSSSSEPPPAALSVFEHCLVDWGDRSRLRLRVTARIGRTPGGEVDLDLMRILLTQEHWTDPVARTPAAVNGVEAAAPPAPPLPSPMPAALLTPLSQRPRATPAQLQGSWSAFTVSAAVVEDVDLKTGEMGTFWVYCSDEARQMWDAHAGAPTEDDGGSLWLPGGVICTFRMVGNSGGGATAATDVPAKKAAAAAAPAAPRGLCVTMTLLQRDGTVAQLEREYNGLGELVEVRHTGAVKGGWSGGRM